MYRQSFSSTFSNVHALYVGEKTQDTRRGSEVLKSVQNRGTQRNRVDCH